MPKPPPSVAALALLMLVAACGTVAGSNPANQPTVAPTSRPVAQASVLPTPPRATFVPTTNDVSFPPARSGAAMAYDPVRKNVVMFGGEGGGAGTSDPSTWTWDGRTWTRNDSPGPSARTGAAMAFDEARGKMILFGGAGLAEGQSGMASPLNDTWSWDGQSWTQLYTTHSPNPRISPGLAYDSLHRQIVLFGGEGWQNDKPFTYNATWTWDGVDWTLRDPRTAPPARNQPGMAYDAKTSEVLMVGGSLPGRWFSDAWVWNGTDWRQVQASPDPGWTTPVFDAARSEIFAWTARVDFNQGLGPDNPIENHMLAWDGTAWTDVTPSAMPVVRVDPALAYDAATQEVVMFGGNCRESVCPNANKPVLSEFWGWDGKSWRQIA